MVTVALPVGLLLLGLHSSLCGEMFGKDCTTTSRLSSLEEQQ